MLGLFGGLAAVPATAATGPKMVRVGAHFFYVQQTLVPNGCAWGIGIVFGSVPGAASYLVTYWDGYYKRVESATISAGQLVPATFHKNAKIWPKEPIAAGSHQLGVTGGTNSDDCGTAAGDPTEGGRFSKGAKAYAVFATGYKPPLADGLDWTMPPRLTGPPNGPEGLPTLREIDPTSWQASVFLTSKGLPAICSGDVRWKWEVKPPKGAKLISGQPKPGCSFKLEGSKLGSYAATATPQHLRKGKWVTAGKVMSEPVVLKDYVIVGLGDSNGSGEGNPPFYYDTCNRSTASYQYQAALYVENQDPRSSVTFLHDSCSGARLDHLVSTPYGGTRPGVTLRPQIPQISTDLSALGTARHVDAVIISAGVNDLAFGPILAFCINAAVTNPNTPCEELPVVPTLDSAHRINGWTQDYGTTPSLRDRLATLQGELLGRYGPVASALTRSVQSGGLGVSAKDVFITQYPDFTNGDNGAPCGPTGLARFGTSTWTWLGQNAAILNRTVAKAAASHGWTLIPIDSQAFATRGYCSSHSLFVGIASAVAGFDVAGPFHPNAEAHLIEAAPLEPRLCEGLGLSATCESKKP